MNKYKISDLILLIKNGNLFRKIKLPRYFKNKNNKIKGDKEYLIGVGKIRLNYTMNLDNPQTFNEKLNWLKIHDRNELFSKLSDKVSVKEYVSNIIGESHVIKTLGVFSDASEINFEILPNNFVLKCNHDSASVIIVRNKNNINKEEIISFLNSRLKSAYSDDFREWVYSKIDRKIICEEYMEEENSKSLTDYKFYCFNGVPQFLYISKGLENHNTATISFYDMNLKLMPFRRTDYKQNKEEIKKPDNWNQMIEIVKKLAQGFKFVRVDLYSINNNTYFSEFTFFPCGGFMKFKPGNWDLKIGQMLKID